MSTRAVTWWTDGIRSEWTLTVGPSKETPPPAAHPLEDLDDRALVDASLAGRTEAFDAIVQRHQQAVYRLCYRFARSREDAMDLSQDVFLRAFKGLGRFRGELRLQRQPKSNLGHGFESEMRGLGVASQLAHFGNDAIDRVVADDPTVDTSSEQKTHGLTSGLIRVRPRWFYGRDA